MQILVSESKLSSIILIKVKKSKKHPVIKVESYGRYSKWERGSRELPKIKEFTTTIKSTEGNEFGMILHISGGKGAKINYCIKHPPFKDKNGNIEPDFIGQVIVPSNNYQFYIGDCIWLPVEDKAGTWEVIVESEGKLFASKKFDIIL